MSKNIVVFMDGTSNQPSKKSPTNVELLFRAAKHDESGAQPQVTRYWTGVGTDITNGLLGGGASIFEQTLAQRAQLKPYLPKGTRWLRPILGTTLGLGLAARIKEAYAFICEHYQRTRGDQVYVFGFSRGAFAARSLAGFLSRVGTLLADKLHLVEAAYLIYEEGLDKDDTLLAGFLRDFAEASMLQNGDAPAAIRIHFLGLWDAVAALEFPLGRLRVRAERTRHHQQDVPPNVFVARHALALHELRKKFEPEVWLSAGQSDLQQVWFPGAHADVGGGYASGETGLADTALRWMVDEATSRGFLLRPDAFSSGAPSAKSILHHEIRHWFFLATPTPRHALQVMETDGIHAISWEATMYFHHNVANHLSAQSDRPYAAWKKSISEALTKVDQVSARLFVLNWLKGRSPP